MHSNGLWSLGALPAPCVTLFVQGGLTLARVLTLLKQAIAALLHLHSLGILHRDMRAANVLIAAWDPVHAMVADFGVSHLLSAFASGDMYKGASKVSSVLAGTAALGPWQVGVSSALLHPTASSLFNPPLFSHPVTLWLCTSSGLPPRCVRAARTAAEWPPPRRTCTWWAASRTSC